MIASTWVLAEVNTLGALGIDIIFTAMLGLASAFGPSPGSCEPIDEVSDTSTAIDLRYFQKLEEDLRAQPEANIHGVLVLIDGQPVFEKYFSGVYLYASGETLDAAFDSCTLHELRSVTKSLLSALVGIGIKEGVIPGPETPISDLFPDHVDSFGQGVDNLTLRSLLTMSAEWEWRHWLDLPREEVPDSDDFRLSRTQDTIEFVLNRRLLSEPGNELHYNNGTSMLIGGLLEERYGIDGEELIKQKLFDPLGIEEFEFRRGISGRVDWSAGLSLRPRDIAKLGQVYLQNGKWNAKQLIPSEWIAESWQPWVERPRGGEYGYHWWLRTVETNRGPIDVKYASGFGGQAVFVVPSLNIVTVVTMGNFAAEYEKKGMLIPPRDILLEYVLPALGVIRPAS